MMYKRIISFLLTVLLLVGTSNIGVFAANTYDYTIEAESYTSCNFSVEGGSVIHNDAIVSGGKYIGLYTKSNKEYEVTYKVNVLDEGIYDLNLASSPVEGTGWSSKIYISVNGAPDAELSGEKQSSTGNSRMDWYYVGAVNLKEGTNTIVYKIKDKISSGYYSAFIDAFGLTKTEFALKKLHCNAPFNVFEQADSITVSLVANGNATTNNSYPYELKNVYGTTVASGNVAINAGSSRGDMVFAGLGLGYYELTASGLTTGFTVVKPYADRTLYKDTPFAIDTNFNGSIYDRGLNAEAYAKVLGLSGVSWVRDRIILKNSATYSNGAYTFSNSRPQSAAKLLDPYGIKVSTAADHMPSNFQNDYGTYISDDLIEVYKFWKSVAANYGSSVDNWEIFNEVDNGGTVSEFDSPDLYAAFMKAAAVGINDGSNAMVSIQGSMLDADHKSEYSNILIRNGVFDYSAFDNAHHHKGVSQPYASYYEFAGATKIENRASYQKELDRKVPIWVTESGIDLRTPVGTDMTKEQQLVQAKYLVTSSIESIAEGTDKHFFFIGPNYHEGDVAWGMMSESTTNAYMYAALPAQAALTDKLGEGIYKGKIDKFGDNVSAYVFNDGLNDVIVVWTKSGSQSVTFNADGTVYDMWGNEISSANGSVTVTADTEPKYIKCTECRETKVNNRDTQINARKVELDSAKKVVMLQKYSDIMRGGSRTDGYMVSDANNKVTLEIANLSEGIMKGQIRYETENGWKLDKNYIDVTLDPMSVKTLEFTITPAEGASIDYLSFIGTFNGYETAPSTAKLVKIADGRIVLEAETGAKSKAGFSQTTASANTYLGVYTQTDGEYEIEFDVVSPNGGVYDLWALASLLTNSASSKYTIKVNGRELSPSAKNTTETVYTSGNHSIGWNTFNDVELKKGVNSVVFTVSAKNGSGYISAALDKIIFIPKTHTGWIEAEDYTTKTGLFYAQPDKTASGGAILKIYTEGIENPIKENQLTYDFAIDTTGSYDVWILSAKANSSSFTKWKIGVDGTPTYPSTSLFNNPVDGWEIEGHDAYWYQIAKNKSLSRGMHTITLRADEIRGAGDEILYLADAIVVVPRKSSYQASWSSNDNIAKAKLDAIKLTLFSEYDTSNITENITLPTKISDVDVSWASSNSAISTDGVVMRPESTGSDVTGNITATFKAGSETGSNNYSMTVKKFADGDRNIELRAELKKTDTGYSNIHLYAKNTDLFDDAATVVAKYSKTTGEFIGFVGDGVYTYTNSADDTFVVNKNRVTCHITGINTGNDVTFVVYKNDSDRPSGQSVAYINDYTPTKDNSEAVFSFETDKGEGAYKVVIKKNGVATSRIIHIFEGQVIYSGNNKNDMWIETGMGKRLIKTQTEKAMPVWTFPTPENDEDIIYKVFLWDWRTLEPFVELITLNN